jgi:hypothetical protein
MTTTNDDGELLDGFDTPEILAFVCHSHGTEALKELLEWLRGVADQDMLLDTAARFENADMRDAASLVRMAAEQAPKQALLATRCPYNQYDTTIAPIHRQYWMKRESRKFTEPDFEYLKRNDPDMLRFLEGQ